jgi:hypothetical protein
LQVTDLEELRNIADHYNLTLGAKLAVAGACDEIENLRRENERLRTAPQEVRNPDGGKVCGYHDGCPPDGPVCHLCAHLQSGGAA